MPIGSFGGFSVSVGRALSNASRSGSLESRDSKRRRQTNLMAGRSGALEDRIPGIGPPRGSLAATSSSRIGQSQFGMFLGGAIADIFGSAKRRVGKPLSQAPQRIQDLFRGDISPFPSNAPVPFAPFSNDPRATVVRSIIDFENKRAGGFPKEQSERTSEERRRVFSDFFTGPAGEADLPSDLKRGFFLGEEGSSLVGNIPGLSAAKRSLLGFKRGGTIVNRPPNIPQSLIDFTNRAFNFSSERPPLPRTKPDPNRELSDRSQALAFFLGDIERLQRNRPPLPRLKSTLTGETFFNRRAPDSSFQNLRPKPSKRSKPLSASGFFPIPKLKIPKRVATRSRPTLDFNFSRVGESLGASFFKRPPKRIPDPISGFF